MYISNTFISSEPRARRHRRITFQLRSESHVVQFSAPLTIVGFVHHAHALRTQLCEVREGSVWFQLARSRKLGFVIQERVVRRDLLYLRTCLLAAAHVPRYQACEEGEA